MQKSKITIFINDLKLIESLLLTIETSGLVSKVFRYKNADTLNIYKKVELASSDFDSKLFDLLSLIRAIDKQLWETILLLTTETQLGVLIGKIHISIKISIARKDPGALNNLFETVSGHSLKFSGISIKEGKKHPEDDLSINKLLSSLNRLISLAKKADEIYHYKLSFNDEIFKPSNINIAGILISIENSLEDIQNNLSINRGQKDHLLEYLEEIKIELTKKNPAWRNILGGLVIVATLLSGISGVASAPEAFENISEAIKHILGTSIEKHMPPVLPQLPRKKKEKKSKTEFAKKKYSQSLNPTA